MTVLGKWCALAPRDPIGCPLWINRWSFLPHLPNFASKKRIQHCMCESKHTLKCKWLISVYIQHKPTPPTHTHTKQNHWQTIWLSCGARYGLKRPCVRKSWHHLSTSRLVLSSICPAVGRLMQYWWKSEALLLTALALTTGCAIRSWQLYCQGRGMQDWVLFLLLWMAALHSWPALKEACVTKARRFICFRLISYQVLNAQASWTRTKCRFTSSKPHPKQTAPLQRTELSPSVTNCTKKTKGEDNPREKVPFLNSLSYLGNH